MASNWEEKISCATKCARCEDGLTRDTLRILSVYDHEAICLPCKKKEEQRPDYESVSKQMISRCMIETEVMYGDPGGYCYHHFYPFTC
ncbi:MAG: hypothetical protein HKM93_15060 [Desulfobacteraceae bacterium]|nr:hypothetical protein [Desulfobacteraceae bacterium]